MRRPTGSAPVRLDGKISFGGGICASHSVRYETAPVHACCDLPLFLRAFDSGGKARLALPSLTPSTDPPSPPVVGDHHLERPQRLVCACVRARDRVCCRISAKHTSLHLSNNLHCPGCRLLLSDITARSRLLSLAPATLCCSCCVPPDSANLHSN